MEFHERPDVMSMLPQLEGAYQQLADHYSASPQERERLAVILADLHWYAQRLGAVRWERAPRPSRWSFAEHVWHMTSQALQQAPHPEASALVYFIDHGKEHVGQTAEIFALFEYR